MLLPSRTRSRSSIELADVILSRVRRRRISSCDVVDILRSFAPLRMTLCEVFSNDSTLVYFDRADRRSGIRADPHARGIPGLQTRGTLHALRAHSRLLQ